MPLEVVCPNCGLRLEISDTTPIDEVICPNCNFSGIITAKTIEEDAVLGPYRLERKIGSGGMGDVYLAEHVTTGQRLALKVLPPVLSRDEKTISRFRHEVKMLASLHHPNIVAAYDAGADSGVYYLAMEHVEHAKDLGSILKDHGRLEEQEALRIVREVALALHYAWEDKHIIHRDIKPANIMVDDNKHVKVMDFGLSKCFDDLSHLSLPGQLIGTPHYLPPERIRGSDSIDTRSDMYSLGATLYHLLTGEQPFSGRSLIEVMTKHATQPMPSPRKKNPGLSDGCVNLIEAMLAKEPQDRHENWSALLADIDRVMAGKLPHIAAPDLGRSMVMPWTDTLITEGMPMGGEREHAGRAASDNRYAGRLRIVLLSGVFVGLLAFAWHTHISALGHHVSIQSIVVAKPEPLLADPNKRENFFRLVDKLEAREIVIALPYELREHADGPATCVLPLAGSLRNFLSDAHGAGLRVCAMYGRPELALSANYDETRSVLEAVIAFNRSGTAGAPFHGVIADIRPYDLIGFNIELQEELLRQYLDVLDRAAQFTRQSGDGLGFEATLPFWYDLRRGTWPEGCQVDFRGERKDASKHVIDLLKRVRILPHRNFAEGSDGVIVYTIDEMEYAQRRNRKVFIGMDAAPYSRHPVYFARPVVKAAWPSFAEEHGDLLLTSRLDGFPLLLESSSNYYFIGLRDKEPGDQTAMLHRSLSRLSEVCRDHNERVVHQQAGPDTDDLMFHAMNEWIENNIQFDGCNPVIDPNQPRGHEVIGYGTTCHSLDKVTFAGKKPDDIQRVLKEISGFFSSYTSFGGYTMHSYESLAPVFGSK